MARILIAEDDTVAREAMTEILLSAGHAVDAAKDGEEAITLVRHATYHLVITDLHMPRQNGMDVLRETLAVAPETKVMVVTAYGTIDQAVEAMKAGAADFMTKPISIEAMEIKVKKLVEEGEVRRERDILKEALDKTFLFEGVASQNKRMRAVLDMVKKVADTTSCVLITGESGTGKEVIARTIHSNSGRQPRPFIAINCAALATGILESELFGHEKGAFTGAGKRRIGRFEQAHLGTLFLDEIGDLSPELQVKLLRVLQEKTFERVGGNEPIKVDVRIIAATHQNLEEKIKKGQFREDLYYRLKVVDVPLPPLRERREDIPVLIDHFIRTYGKELNKPMVGMDAAALRILTEYNWPGNIRELENVVERAMVLGKGRTITSADLPELKTAGPARGLTGDSLDEQKSNLEKEIIIDTLKRANNKQVKAAELLGMDRTTLRYRMKKYGLL